MNTPAWCSYLCTHLKAFNPKPQARGPVKPLRKSRLLPCQEGLQATLQGQPAQNQAPRESQIARGLSPSEGWPRLWSLWRYPTYELGAAFYRECKKSKHALQTESSQSPYSNHISRGESLESLVNHLCIVFLAHSLLRTCRHEDQVNGLFDCLSGCWATSLPNLRAKAGLGASFRNMLRFE